MSKLTICGLAAGLTLLGATPGQAWSLLGAPLDTAPWCVVYDIGAGVVQENCRMPSFAACNRERALQGGTAFCRQNPAFAYAPGYGQPRKQKRKRYR
jgi:hypothetical protein